MHDATDMDLLRQYAGGNSDDAFAALVARHVDLVYSAALRKTGNPHAAEEITQAVFIILAQKAGRILDKTILPGWLYQTARLTVSSFLRRETRRARREQEVFMLSESDLSRRSETEADEIWKQFAPLLEDAMGQLGDKDRAAIVLRFFGGKSFAEVATAAGVSENAAKKRVSHALEKLRRYFSRRGVSSTTEIIAGALSTHSVQAAPVALAKLVTAVAVAKGAAAGGSTLTLIKGALKIMAWTKAKTAVVAGVVVLLAAGTTVTVQEIQEHKTYSWEVPKADFGTFYRTPAQVVIVPTKFSENGDWCCDSGRGAMGIAQPVKEIIQVAYQKDQLRTIVGTGLPAGKFDFFAKLVGPREAQKNMPVNQKWTLALQKEITRKFGITGRLEMRATDVLVLKPGAAGTRGFKISHTMPKGHALDSQPGNYSFFEQPISTLTGLLEQRVKIPIVDQTGLAGEYDFFLKWYEPDPRQPDLDGLKQALLDQLGLELVPSREPIEMLVVDR